MSANGAPPVDPARAAESHLAQILTLTGCFHAVALLTVGARLYVRFIVVKTAGRDDAMMILATMGTLIGMACFGWQAPYGLGKHQDTISKPDYMEFNKAAFVQSLCSAMGALGFLKISIGLSLLRLSKHRWYTRTIWMLIAFVIFYTLLAWLSLLLMCRPLSGFWDKRLNAKCYPMEKFIQFGIANTAFNIFTDVCFATLPVPIIWDLQMKLRKRVYLILVLSLGYIAVAMGIVKAVYQIGFGASKDKTFDQSIQVWGFLQLNTGIVAACAHALKPLLGRFLKLNTTNNYYYGRSGDNFHRYYGGGGGNNSRSEGAGAAAAGKSADSTVTTTTTTTTTSPTAKRRSRQQQNALSMAVASRRRSDYYHHHSHSPRERGRGGGGGGGAEEAGFELADHASDAFGDRSPAAHVHYRPDVRTGESGYDSDGVSSQELILQRHPSIAAKGYGIAVTTEIDVRSVEKEPRAR